MEEKLAAAEARGAATGRQFQGVLDAFQQKNLGGNTEVEPTTSETCKGRVGAWHNNLFESPKKRLQARWEEVSPSLKEKLQRYSPRALRDFLGDKEEKTEQLSAYQENVAAMQDCSQMLAERQSRYKQIAAFYLDDSPQDPSQLNQSYLFSTSQDNNSYLETTHAPSYSLTNQVPEQGQKIFKLGESLHISTSIVEFEDPTLNSVNSNLIDSDSLCDKSDTLHNQDQLNEKFVISDSRVANCDNSSEPFVVDICENTDVAVEDSKEKQPIHANTQDLNEREEVEEVHCSSILEADIVVPLPVIEESDQSQVWKSASSVPLDEICDWAGLVQSKQCYVSSAESNQCLNSELLAITKPHAVEDNEPVTSFDRFSENIKFLPEIALANEVSGEGHKNLKKLSCNVEDGSSNQVIIETSSSGKVKTDSACVNNPIKEESGCEKETDDIEKPVENMTSMPHIVVPLPDAHQMRKSPVTVQEWVDHLPVKIKLPDERLDESPSLMDRPSMLRCEAASRLSREASVQSSSSLDSLLDSRRPDPVEVLLNLGFGGSPGIDLENCRIPKRFLIPSQCKGGDWNEFLRRELLQVQNFECASLGFRGLSGPSHQRPSAIVANIMEKLRERAAPRPPPRTRFTSVARRVLSETSVLNKLNYNSHLTLSTPSSVLTPDNRKFLDSQGKISPEVPRRRIIFGQKSFAIDKDGELVEVEPSPPKECTSSGGSTNTDTEDSDHVASAAELLRMRRSSLQRQRKVEENSDEDNNIDLPKIEAEVVIPEIREPGKGSWRLRSSSSLQLVPEDNDDLRGEIAAEIETLSRKIQTAPREELAAILEPIKELRTKLYEL